MQKSSWIVVILVAANLGGWYWLKAGERHWPSARVSHFKAEKQRDDSISFRLQFTTDMIPGDRVGRVLPHPVVQFHPFLEGDAVFETPKELVFIPSKPLRRATPYVVSLAPELRNIFGKAIDGQSEFHHSTKPLRLLGSEAIGRTPSGLPVMEVAFNDRVLPADLESAVSVVDARGRPVRVAALGIEADRKVRLVVQRHAVSMRLPQGFAGIAGPLGLSQPAMTRVDPKNRLIPAEGFRGFRSPMVDSGEIGLTASAWVLKGR